jgi:hypothetical protein
LHREKNPAYVFEALSKSFFEAEDAPKVGEKSRQNLDCLHAGTNAGFLPTKSRRPGQDCLSFACMTFGESFKV